MKLLKKFLGFDNRNLLLALFILILLIIPDRYLYAQVQDPS